MMKIQHNFCLFYAFWANKQPKIIYKHRKWSNPYFTTKVVVFYSINLYYSLKIQKKSFLHLRGKGGGVEFQFFLLIYTTAFDCTESFYRIKKYYFFTKLCLVKWEEVHGHVFFYCSKMSKIDIVFLKSHGFFLITVQS